MKFPLSTSEKGQKATELVRRLQQKFVDELSNASDPKTVFEVVDWLRDEGIHGGGERYVAAEGGIFDRASVNVSHVHYDDLPEKKLASASALSAIVHPDNPNAPSIHIHFSWTELRDGTGYWRMMADLNPSLPNPDHKKMFEDTLKQYAGEHFESGKEQGDAYFYVEALDVHRGVSHFYLEGFDSGDFEKDFQFAEKLASEVIQAYGQILKLSLDTYPNFNQEDKQKQIDYHTLYLYQVLTLDKGTTAGIMVHNQNDLGVFGSLPSTINSGLLKSWIENTPPPLSDLVARLLKVFPEEGNVNVGDQEKIAFAKIVRAFYGNHSELLTFRN